MVTNTKVPAQTLIPRGVKQDKRQTNPQDSQDPKVRLLRPQNKNIEKGIPRCLQPEQEQRKVFLNASIHFSWNHRKKERNVYGIKTKQQ